MANPPYCVRVGGAGGSSDWHHESELRQIVDRLSNTLIMKTVRWMGVLTSLDGSGLTKQGERGPCGSEHGPKSRHLPRRSEWRQCGDALIASSASESTLSFQAPSFKMASSPFVFGQSRTLTIFDYPRLNNDFVKNSLKI